MARQISPEVAQSHLSSFIESGRSRGESAMALMRDEFLNRTDRIVDSTEIEWTPTDSGLLVRYGTNGDREQRSMTPHAQRQILERVGVPPKFYSDLAGDPLDVPVVARLLSDLAANHPQRMLLRSVRGTVKGALSDSYRPLDFAPLAEQFLVAGIAAGMIVVGGSVTETRVEISMILPRIMEPTPGEFIVFGVSLITSDYGRHALVIPFNATRLVCVNGMLGTNLFRKVHLGKRFEDGADFLSAETKALDSQTVGSAIRDLIAGDRFRQEIDRTVALIADGSRGESLDAEGVIDRWQRRGRITREEARKASVLYREVDVVEQLPASPGLWRLSNVFSLMAGNVPDNTDRRLDLMEVAAEVLEATK